MEMEIEVPMALLVMVDISPINLVVDVAVLTVLQVVMIVGLWRIHMELV